MRGNEPPDADPDGRPGGVGGASEQSGSLFRSGYPTFVTERLLLGFILFFGLSQQFYFYSESISLCLQYLCFSSLGSHLSLSHQRFTFFCVFKLLIQNCDTLVAADCHFIFRVEQVIASRNQLGVTRVPLMAKC